MWKRELESMIFGFLLGDGWISKVKDKNHYQCGFSGDVKSLENLKSDLILLYNNIGKAKINTRNTKSNKYNIEGITNSMVVNMSICHRYINLGMPIGKRVESEFLLPEWITKGTKAIKSNFLSGLYAAEGHTPSMQKNDKTPKVLGLTITKRTALKNNFDSFLMQISEILKDLEIEYSLSTVETITCDENIKAVFSFDNSTKNIIRISNLLDLRYCVDKGHKLSVLNDYLEEKQKTISILEEAYIESLDKSNTAKSIAIKYGITQSQIESWRLRKTGVRIPNSFPTITEFTKTYCPL